MERAGIIESLEIRGSLIYIYLAMDLPPEQAGRKHNLAEFTGFALIFGVYARFA
jgi:hypothetical protein